MRNHPELRLAIYALAAAVLTALAAKGLISGDDSDTYLSIVDAALGLAFILAAKNVDRSPDQEV